MKKNLFVQIRNFFSKIIIGSIKYGRKGDYNAERYWHDRFHKYGLSLKGSGDEGYSEEMNKQTYLKLKALFINICDEEKINYKTISALDIGCGTGFFTKLLQDYGVEQYTGIDITDILFPQLYERYPNFVFLKKDITKENLDKQFDLIIMIDVLEHIVNKAKFNFALENIKKSLSNNGIIIMGPISRKSKKRFFYLRFWSRSDLELIFKNYFIKEEILAPTNSFFIIKK